MKIKLLIIFSFLFVFSVFSQENKIYSLWKNKISNQKIQDTIPKEFQIQLNVLFFEENNNQQLIDQNVGKFYSNRISYIKNDYPIYEVITGFYDNKYVCLVNSKMGSLFLIPQKDFKETIIDSSEEFLLNFVSNSILNSIKWILILDASIVMHLY